MSAYLDLPSPAPTSPVQVGAKQVSYPLQGDGDYYSVLVRRNMLLQPAANYAPIIGNLTTYTNLLTYSEDLANAAWTKNDATATANVVANPADGQVTCGKLLENATTAVHSISRSLTMTAAPSNVSVIAKPISRNHVQLVYVDSAATTFSGFFNLATGAAGTLSAGVTANIIPLANSFYRASIHFTPASGAGTVKVQISTDGSTTNYAGDAAKGFYLWGLQALTGTSPGPYVSTTANTRAVSAPPIDSDDDGNIQDPFAYLVEETAPDLGSLERGIARWERVAARVPPQITTYSTLSLNKPSVAGLSGALLSNQYFLYGDSSLSVSYTYSIYSGYIWASNNKVYGVLANTTSTTSGSNTRITWTSHGLAGTETVIASGAGGFAGRYAIFAPGAYSVIDANTIDLLGVNYTTLSTSCGKYFRDYTPGLDRIGCKVIKNFYLPGVTSGIATAADIPIPDPLLNDLAFMNAVINTPSTYANYDARDLVKWMGTAIYELDTVQINMADV
jgi:hypothetical protein